MLREAFNKRDFSEDAAIIDKAAIIVRNDIFNHSLLVFHQNVRRTHYLEAQVTGLTYIQWPKLERLGQT